MTVLAATARLRLAVAAAARAMRRSRRTTLWLALRCRLRWPQHADRAFVRRRTLMIVVDDPADNMRGALCRPSRLRIAPAPTTRRSADRGVGVRSIEDPRPRSPSADSSRHRMPFRQAARRRRSSQRWHRADERASGSCTRHELQSGPTHRAFSRRGRVRRSRQRVSMFVDTGRWRRLSGTRLTRSRGLRSSA